METFDVGTDHACDDPEVAGLVGPRSPSRPLTATSSGRLETLIYPFVLRFHLFLGLGQFRRVVRGCLHRLGFPLRAGRLLLPCAGRVTFCRPCRLTLHRRGRLCLLAGR